MGRKWVLKGGTHTTESGRITHWQNLQEVRKSSPETTAVAQRDHMYFLQTEVNVPVNWTRKERLLLGFREEPLTCG